MPAAFVICTRNRRDDLLRCLASVARQTLPPAEVVVVDSGDERDADAQTRALAGSGIPFLHLESPPGLTRQRNAGVRASSADPVCFLDDDVELDPCFHEELLRAFEAGQDVGGVQGRVEGEAPRAWPFRAYRALFLQSRRTSSGRARMLASGFYTIPTSPQVLQEAEVLRGSAFAFRRAVLDELSFDESLEGYGLKEDVDFSYRVSRRWRLLIAPRARYRHHKSPAARLGVRDKCRMHAVNNYRLFRKNMGGTPLQWAAFWWAMAGRLLYNALRAVVKRHPGYLLGTIDGLREIARLRRAGAW